MIHEIQENTEILEKAKELYENMFYAIPSKGLTVKEHDEAAIKCAKLAALVGKYNCRDNEMEWWQQVINALHNL